ncbi:diguanylate cyclase (GGDEF)-like protein [Agrobacterium vitis]|nr:diguanylate cyclase (GGDEF)-like protein [Agrobacterium vitis]MBE1438460.1 diguanylate cyclase (GGDEF)-like protein [Agrobacterium vitis]
MVDLFNVPTLNLCGLVASLIVAMLMLFSWCFEKKSAELAFWAIGYFCIATGQMLQSLRGIIPESYGMGGGILFLLLGMGFIWIGFRAFDGFSRPYIWVVLVATVWIILCLAIPDFLAVPNHRIGVYNFLFVPQLALGLWSVWLGWRQERLPARILILVMGVLYAVLTMARLPLAIVYPVMEVNGIAVTPWFNAMTFVLYCDALGLGFGVFSLVRERSLRQYKHASETDMLTGVLNRRAFYDQALKRLRRAEGVIALIDIDHFKSVNDSHGHACGDLVLQRFTQIVTAHLSADMVFGRMGGEEFAVLIPAHGGHDAMAFCEAIRNAVSQMSILWRDRQIGVTISIGVCCLPDQMPDLETALMRADSALYEAKHYGRNCVRSYSGPQARKEQDEVMAGCNALSGSGLSAQVPA